MLTSVTKLLINPTTPTTTTPDTNFRANEMVDLEEAMKTTRKREEMEEATKTKMKRRKVIYVDGGK